MLRATGRSGSQPLDDAYWRAIEIFRPLTVVYAAVLVWRRQDEMVPLPRAVASRDALTSLGYAVEWHDYPMGHSVCADEVQDVRSWLLRVLHSQAE